jgi:hypothetical protein
MVLRSSLRFEGVERDPSAVSVFGRALFVAITHTPLLEQCPQVVRSGADSWRRSHLTACNIGLIGR